MKRRAKKVKGESKRKPNWLELPVDLTKNILQRLDTVEIVTSARNVCTLWRKVCNDPQMWRTIHMTGDFSIYRFDFCHSDLEKICRCAIDLSCGNVEDIDIELFGTDDLLSYMAHRASHLRRLRLLDCDQISDKGLSEFVKFSLLEELDISSFKKISMNSLEIIGQCCPLLKSLNFETTIFTSVKGTNLVFCIAKTVPALRYITLSGFDLCNDDLLAILDAFPLIESFDIRKCRCYNLSPSLEKRCRKQIKDLQLPTYFVDDDDDDHHHHHDHDRGGLAYMDTFEDTYANDDWEY